MEGTGTAVAEILVVVQSQDLKSRGTCTQQQQEDDLSVSYRAPRPDFLAFLEPLSLPVWVSPCH